MRFERKLWKKIAAMLLAIVLTVTLALPGTIGQASAATTEPGIMLDGRKLDNAQAITIGGTTMVPIRVVSEQLGHSVNWNQATGRIQIGTAPASLTLTLGSRTAASYSGSITMQQAPFVRSNTTYVPLRFVGSQMGLAVRWEQSSGTVYLQTQLEAPSLPTTPPTDTSTQPVNSNTASINSISFSDNRLTISADSSVKPEGSVLRGPDRIVVDLPDSSFGPGLLQNQTASTGQVVTLPVTGSSAVKQVRYSLFSQSPSTVRVVIDLNRSTGHKLYTQGNLVLVDLNDDGAAAPIGTGGKKVVVIDPGHGDQDPGGIGVTGKREKDMVLSVSLKVAALLKQEPNIDLIMTRTDDTFIPLDGRVKIAQDAKADVFLSIHGNAASSNAGGTETFYADTKRSKALSDTIQKHVLAATGFRDRGSKQANYLVIRKTTMPAALLEIGFMTNANEEKLMMQDAFQQKVAKAIVAGIKEYLANS